MPQTGPERLGDMLGEMLALVVVVGTPVGVIGLALYGLYKLIFG